MEKALAPTTLRIGRNGVHCQEQVLCIGNAKEIHMLLHQPLAIWLGFLTILLLCITVSLGLAMKKHRKSVYKPHRIFAIITLIIALAHVTLAVLLWFFGITV